MVATSANFINCNVATINYYHYLSVSNSLSPQQEIQVPGGLAGVENKTILVQKTLCHADE
jgi:hypothetical protein